MKEHLYRVATVWTGAAQGATTDYRSYAREYTVQVEGKPTLVGSADPTFRGDAKLYNPEDLLVISLSACHLLSYLALCARSRIQVISYCDRAEGKMSVIENKMRFTEVILRPKVLISAGDNLEKAIALHQQAHEECFIANSVAFPVTHYPTVRITRNSSV
ncbi:OsmC family protein [Oscillatoria sp. FACHB-1406]|uniref:OsmC family protein n=1 Tax=Oscillatoria sp. FACHB-1406 TaxID=2692846 RepID=UPI001688D523|nr:OsmC family protein [Oscillatoria sp. FACHB-1406]MBD2578417.1 OsmC family protein [Oscillatoria sp. FACHB-1406]